MICKSSLGIPGYCTIRNHEVPRLNGHATTFHPVGIPELQLRPKEVAKANVIRSVEPL